jgi:hypothetical protein
VLVFLAFPLVVGLALAELESWAARVERFASRLQAWGHLYGLRRQALAFAEEQPFFRQAAWQEFPPWPLFPFLSK